LACERRQLGLSVFDLFQFLKEFLSFSGVF
jgi:hypothetical protein